MTWFRDLMGFNSSLPQLVWEKKALLLLLLLLSKVPILLQSSWSLDELESLDVISGY